MSGFRVIVVSGALFEPVSDIPIEAQYRPWHQTLCGNLGLTHEPHIPI